MRASWQTRTTFAHSSTEPRAHDERCRAAIELALVAQQRRRVGRRHDAARANDVGDARERGSNRIVHRGNQSASDAAPILH
jgi:hypothetical protein